MKAIEKLDYGIFIGSKSLQEFDYSSYSQLAILVDENTRKHCLAYFLETTKVEAVIIEVKSGERNKNLASCQHIWESLSQHQLDRKALLINLGGGVIGDMGGFAASTFKRGIDFLQIPTTLLAMVDASVGGKLGIDFAFSKNQIGLFKNPKSVLIDPVFLNTLAPKQVRSGFAEVVKHALIADKEYWQQIKNTPFSELDWESVISQSVKIKSALVCEDPNEKGQRKKLNFGHTIGHAIESHYLAIGKPILHGEAIALGMKEECKLSPLSASEKKEINSFLSTTFPTLKVPSKELLLKWLIQDKKNSNGQINFTLLTSIGSCLIDNQFEVDELLA